MANNHGEIFEGASDIGDGFSVRCVIIKEIN